MGDILKRRGAKQGELRGREERAMMKTGKRDPAGVFWGEGGFFIDFKSLKILKRFLLRHQSDLSLPPKKGFALRLSVAAGPGPGQAESRLGGKKLEPGATPGNQHVA